MTNGFPLLAYWSVRQTLNRVSTGQLRGCACAFKFKQSLRRSTSWIDHVPLARPNKHCVYCRWSQHVKKRSSLRTLSASRSIYIICTITGRGRIFASSGGGLRWRVWCGPPRVVFHFIRLRRISSWRRKSLRDQLIRLRYVKLLVVVVALPYRSRGTK